jgi:hypothetical protein
MTTQRSLSAAAPASEGYPYPAVRLSQRMRWHRPARRGSPKGPCAVAKPRIQSIEAIPSLPAKSPRQFLIANPELEFNVRPLRITDLRFSNRKFSAIFHPIFPSFKHLSPRPVVLPALTLEGTASDKNARSEESQLRPHAISPSPPRVNVLMETPRLEITVTSRKQKRIRTPNRHKSGILCRQLNSSTIRPRRPPDHHPRLAAATTFRPFPPLC